MVNNTKIRKYWCLSQLIKHKLANKTRINQQYQLKYKAIKLISQSYIE